MKKVWVVSYLIPTTFGIVIEPTGESRNTSLPAVSRNVGVFSDEEKALEFAAKESKGHTFKTYSVQEVVFFE